MIWLYLLVMSLVVSPSSCCSLSIYSLYLASIAFITPSFRLTVAACLSYISSYSRSLSCSAFARFSLSSSISCRCFECCSCWPVYCSCCWQSKYSSWAWSICDFKVVFSAYNSLHLSTYFLVNISCSSSLFLAFIARSLSPSFISSSWTYRSLMSRWCVLSSDCFSASYTLRFLNRSFSPSISSFAIFNSNARVSAAE